MLVPTSILVFGFTFADSCASSAAPFADRVVHHALMQALEPRFEVLRQAWLCRVPQPDVMTLLDGILASGDGVHAGDGLMLWFAGGDLLAIFRSCGLPIGAVARLGAQALRRAQGERWGLRQIRTPCLAS